MRQDELKACLDAMTDAEFAQFRIKFGDRSATSRKWFVEHFATSDETWKARLRQLLGKPTEQVRISQLLGLPTEQDRIRLEPVSKPFENSERASQLQ